MPGKNSKQVVQKTETPVEVSPPVDAVKQVQKGGKKAKVVEVAPPVVETPVVETPVVETPVKVAQKGGKKAKAVVAPVEVAPVEVAPVEVAPVEVASVEVAPVKVAQKGGKKAKAVESPVKVAQKGGKKAKAVETPVKDGKKAKSVEVPVETETDAVVVEDDRRVRSFKVKLPDREDFEGRFTGLTPYQAANKALSKYFRETENPKVEITFSICESTRKSKKSTYTYVGQRQQLDVPVKYTIQDGREIVKNFKNSLKKVKKADTLSASA
jgi:hypothetical protein